MTKHFHERWALIEVISASLGQLGYNENYEIYLQIK